MLLQEKMRNTKFSPSEQSVIDFMLKKQEELEPYSTTMIAQETYTSPSILVRAAKKLGYPGFTELKKAFLEEVWYLLSRDQDLDPNLPFTPEMSLIQTASSIARIEENSIQETMQMLKEPVLRKAVRMMQQAKIIHVFAVSNVCLAAEEFVFKLRHIGFHAHCYSLSNTMVQEAAMAKKDDLAVLVSYSGESTGILQIARILRNLQVPFIAITSIGENSLSRMSTLRFCCATREKSWSKIGSFSSLTSISFLFDALYACCFRSDFQHSLDYKLEISRRTEVRNIDNAILREEDNSTDLLDDAWRESKDS